MPVSVSSIPNENDAFALPAINPSVASWDYDEAFSRHRGLISLLEQDKLRKSKVAIIGMGGVGGIHLATLARLGIGNFHIADPDCFELANTNRQYGSSTKTFGKSKANTMADIARDINPEVGLRVFDEAITPENVGEFLEGVDVVVDGVDFFNIQARRLVFCEARSRGMWAITAGPIGFSTAWLSFDPNGMSFDDYFDIDDRMLLLDQLIAFAVGLTPRGTHLKYLDLEQVELDKQTGPSAALACHLASGVAASEVLKILLGRGPLRPAPHYFQFDSYRQIFRRGRIRSGNRHPWQRIKRSFLRRRFASALLPAEPEDTRS